MTVEKHIIMANLFLRTPKVICRSEVIKHRKIQKIKSVEILIRGEYLLTGVASKFFLLQEFLSNLHYQKIFLLKKQERMLSMST